MTEPRTTTVVVGDRQTGKTTRLVEWVQAGERRPLYPFWSRVLLVASRDHQIQVRDDFGLDGHQVFNLADWSVVHRGVHDAVEVAVDDAELLLQFVVGGFGLSMVGMTAQAETLAPAG